MSNPTYAFVTIVSGLPRSGTSVMMQMLKEGGLPLLVDGERQPDDDNPRGYLELEAIKSVARDPSCLQDAQGKAVKVIHSLIPHLPLDRPYRVIFMQRNLEEVMASQRKMLDRQNRKGAALPDAQLKQIFSNQVSSTLRWMREREMFRVLETSYAELIAEPAKIAARVNDFLGGGLNEAAMAAAVDPSLYRNKQQKGTPAAPPRDA